MAAINWLGSRPGHMQYGEFLFGPGTAWRWDELQGWEETPGLDSGSVLKASDHGAWPGIFYAQNRTVTASLVVRCEPGNMNGTLRQLAAATPIDAADEIPLVVQLDDDAPLMVFARCTRRAFQVARGHRVGMARGAIEFEASDPRRYSLLETTSTTALPQPEPGLAWPLVFPLDFGTPGSTGNITAVNSGDAPTHPRFAITGPCSHPIITNLSTGALLEYDIDLSASDTLYVDTNQGTVTLNGLTANRLYTATTRSQPEGSFTLPAGSSALAFRSDDADPDPASTLTVTWRSAFW
ncbi:minor tail protein [Streptomyces phage Keanu]|nr:minor tail protein [Streptomyces phage Keanu]